jgi:hypothetical protein
VTNQRRLGDVVGPIEALSFVTAIDDPSLFKRSRDVAAYFGLTSRRRWQRARSIDVHGRISKAGDPGVRRALYEPASALLTRFKRNDKVKTWGACDCQAHEPPQGDGGGGPQACSGHACDVGGWQILLRRSGDARP